MPSRRAHWLSPLAFTIHNLEEAATMPAFWERAGRLRPPVEAPALWFALAVITGAAWLLAWAAGRSERSPWRRIEAGWWGMVLLNVLFPHVLGSLYLLEYAPGVVTAVVLNLPVHAYLLREELRTGTLAPRAAVLATAGVSAVVLGSIPVLLGIGRIALG